MTCLRHHSRRGPLLAATIVSFAVLGFGIGQALCGDSHDPGFGIDHAVALCLIVATLATAAALASPPPRQQRRVPLHLRLSPASAAGWSYVPVARASPVWLGRFLN